MSAWFETWFDSPLYPLLYNNRDSGEAEVFIRNLVTFLKPDLNTEILDLGCGRGRHSIFLHQLGYKVVGIDLSEKSILAAKDFEKPGLWFSTGDMRKPISGKYDIVLNLFTSFGYFQNDEEHLSVLKNICSALKPSGILVLDFFNSTPLKNQFPEEKIETRGAVSFHIHKKMEGNYVVKNIKVTDGTNHPEFSERVRFFKPEELISLCIAAGFSVFEKWGTYSGDAFQEQDSPRLVLFCKKMLTN